MAENTVNAQDILEIPTDMTNEEIVTQFCLANKVTKTATEELIKRGFMSLEALKLVEMDDLGSEKIPKGQRWLILHISQSLLRHSADGSQDGTASTNGTVNAGTAFGTANGGASSTGSGVTTAVQNGTAMQISQEVEPDITTRPLQSQQNEHSDVYSSLINNMVLQQRNLCSNTMSDPSPVPPT